jgi:FeS assembly SUF system protein
MAGDAVQTPSESTQDLSTVEQKLIENQVVEAIRTCYDPEIPVNIYEMGLIYGVTVDPAGVVSVTMTLTTPHCPAAQSLPREVEGKAKSVPGVKDVEVRVVWEPAWNPSMMSEAAKLELGFF